MFLEKRQLPSEASLLSTMLLFIFVFIIGANCELKLNGLFQSNMVLQEPVPELEVNPTRIYGQALITETGIHFIHSYNNPKSHEYIMYQ